MPSEARGGSICGDRISLIVSQAPLFVPELQLWLEWAGVRLLSMNIKSPFPKEPGTAWPEYQRDPTEAYGYSGERLRPAIPDSVEIELMDKLLAFVSLLPDITTRRILNARALIAPISNRHLYSWTKIAFMLHTSRPVVQRLHAKGLKDLALLIPKDKIHAVRLLINTTPL